MNRQTLLSLLAAILLLGGLGAALAIGYSAAHASPQERILGLENSKKYEHELAVYGGDMNVLADRFHRWFASLWQGESLAYTVAVLAVCASAGVGLAAWLSPSGQEPTER